MTRKTNDSGGTALPDGERLHEAFAEELDRPGLDGPSYDSVLRTGTARLRRRRVTVGATFALASVTAVATAVLATGAGRSHGVNTAETGTNRTTGTSTGSTTPAAASGTTSAPSASGLSTASSGTTSAPTSSGTPLYPADAVLASGTLEGHEWKLVREFKLDTGPPPGITGPGVPTKQPPQWCGSLNVIVDGVWTNAGGEAGCVSKEHPQWVPSMTEPGFASVGILTPQHVRLGAIVMGSVDPKTASVTAQCAEKTFTDKPFQPSGDTNAYYFFTLPNGSGCKLGTLSFFDASGSRTASLPDVGFEGGK